MDLPCAPWPRAVIFVRTDEGHKELASIERTDTEEGSANARLIAAAPEMYEVIKSIAEHFGVDAYHDSEQVLQWQNRARALLAGLESSSYHRQEADDV